MDKRTKIALIVLGALFLAGAIGVVIYQLTKNNKSEDDMDDTPAPPGPTPAKTNSADNSGGFGGGGTSGSGAGASWQDPSKVNPTFNVEGELSNKFSELKGRILYPKRKFMGGWDYTNVRTYPEVNTDQGWWDTGNLITTLGAGTKIGKVLAEERKTYNGYTYRWFKVELSEPTGGFFSPYTEGFVRADTVTFAPYSI